MSRVRPPAVAGTFYPSDADLLRAQVGGCLGRARPPDGFRRDPVLRSERGGGTISPSRPVALVSPHAGYVYSGPVAGSAYASLGAVPTDIRCVILLGPAHYVPVAGIAVPGASVFTTPLGGVPVDEAGVDRALNLPGVEVSPEAHAPEHSLEVQIPFLQVVLGVGFSVIPLLVGSATDERVEKLLDEIWRPDTLVVVSTDLSHYLAYADAARRDARTADAIEALDPSRIGPEDACGSLPLRGLLRAARARGLRCERLDLRSSGDTAGPLDRVVGYGAFAFV